MLFNFTGVDLFYAIDKIKLGWVAVEFHEIFHFE